MAVLRPQASGGSGRALRAEPAESNTATAPPGPPPAPIPSPTPTVATLSRRAPASNTTRDRVGPQSCCPPEAKRLASGADWSAGADWSRRLRQVEQDGTAAGGGGGVAGSVSPPHSHSPPEIGLSSAPPRSGGSQGPSPRGGTLASDSATPASPSSPLEPSVRCELTER